MNNKEKYWLIKQAAPAWVSEVRPDDDLQTRKGLSILNQNYMPDAAKAYFKKLDAPSSITLNQRPTFPERPMISPSWKEDALDKKNVSKGFSSKLSKLFNDKYDGSPTIDLGGENLVDKNKLMNVHENSWQGAMFNPWSRKVGLPSGNWMPAGLTVAGHEMSHTGNLGISGEGLFGNEFDRWQDMNVASMKSHHDMPLDSAVGDVTNELKAVAGAEIPLGLAMGWRPSDAKPWERANYQNVAGHFFKGQKLDEKLKKKLTQDPKFFMDTVMDARRRANDPTTPYGGAMQKYLSELIPSFNFKSIDSEVGPELIAEMKPDAHDNTYRHVIGRLNQHRWPELEPYKSYGWAKPVSHVPWMNPTDANTHLNAWDNMIKKNLK